MSEPRLDHPRIISIEPTQRCNLYCACCWRSLFEPESFEGKVFQFSLLQRLDPYLKTAGGVWLSGLGKPLMYDRILDVCGELNVHSHHEVYISKRFNQLSRSHLRM